MIIVKLTYRTIDFRNNESIQFSLLGFKRVVSTQYIQQHSVGILRQVALDHWLTQLALVPPDRTFQPRLTASRMNEREALLSSRDTWETGLLMRGIACDCPSWIILCLSPPLTAISYARRTVLDNGERKNIRVPRCFVFGFLARSQNYEKRLLASSCLSVRTEQLNSQWKNFYEIWDLSKR